MSTITFECPVTEYAVMPRKDNDENIFAINPQCLVINFMDSKKDKILIQSEISKEDAIELARLILLKYNS